MNVIKRLWRSSPSTRIAVAMCATLMISLQSGCSQPDSDRPELASVTGTVLMKGEPLSQAELVFEPESGGAPSYGKTDEQGFFELVYKPGIEGAVPGPHTVRISKYPAPGEPNDTDNLLPDKYSSQSDLKANVQQKQDNEFHFELES